MKKGIAIAVVLFSGAVFMSSVYAGEKQGGVMGKEMMKSSGSDVSSMAMKMMMGKSMVATEDGGVVVMIGNKLLKYDRNLNLKKEVKIEIDFSEMKKMMKKCKKMMDKKKCMIKEKKEEIE
ncbi:MAG: hypothetical protein P9X27_03815 [Candidatus Kaelpia aquatica]|nr:hypothetical protein [Candidatus Kaelpia aquatica]